MMTNNGIAVSVVFFLVLLAFVIPVSAYSDEAVAWYSQGNAFLQSQNYTQAVSAYDHAVALEPQYFEAMNAKADALNRDGKFVDALSASEQSLSVNPDYVTGWINRGQILYNIGYEYEDQVHNMTEADEYYTYQLQAFDKAIELDPTNAEAWFNKAYALAGMKRYDEAIDDFDKVRALNPNYPNLAKNREIAVQLRDASTPVYVKYAGIIIGGIILCAGVALWFFFLREKTE
ncbi:tetratricopeptide repeat protein [Methanoregula sp.]|jgi:tetratricopeptide (TPR) repeat protein|uniref:tetratricopeptide repeat protein n=1 Tax=Methanoregula sp. TaxID=2052170 RepID=UPI003C1B7FF4